MTPVSVEIPIAISDVDTERDSGSLSHSRSNLNLAKSWGLRSVGRPRKKVRRILRTSELEKSPVRGGLEEQ